MTTTTFESKRNDSLARLDTYWHENIANKPELVLALATSMDNKLGELSRMAECGKPFDTDTAGEVVNRIAAADDTSNVTKVRVCGLFSKMQEATEAQMDAFQDALKEHNCTEALDLLVTPIPAEKSDNTQV